MRNKKYENLYKDIDITYHIVRRNEGETPLINQEDIKRYPGPSFQTIVIRYEAPQYEQTPFAVFFDAEYKVSLN